MDLVSQLLKEHSNKNGMKVAKFAKENPLSIDVLIELMTSEVVFQQRASQALCYTVEHFNITLSQNQISKLITMLKNQSLHNAIPRNILKIIELNGHLPEQDESFLFDFCINTIMNVDRPIASRAFAMPVAYAVIEKYPELKQEFMTVLLSLSDFESPGVIARKNKYLKLLS